MSESVSDGEICLSGALIDGGEGVEFDVIRDDEILPAFVIRYRRDVYAYINRCSHMELKLNFLHQDFFDAEKSHLICSTHGALYDPRSGRCQGGACNGVGLQPLAVHEMEGKVRLTQNSNVMVYRG